MSYLSKLRGAEAVLQIIHVSDLHVVATKQSAAQTVRLAERVARKTGFKDLVREIQDKTAPSDPFAALVFVDFVEKITVKDPIWSRCPTWLVDTGDQTTYGDAASFALARQYIASFAAASGPNPANGSLSNLHGNHDAWPEDFPLFARVKIPPHMAALAAPPHACAIGTAQAPFRTRLPSGDEIQLFTMDTVNEGFLENTWARGYVGDPQLNQLDSHLQAHQGSASARHLRILAAHHPVHFPAPRPRYVLVIANEDHVGKRLSGGTPSIHLVISGHTHTLFPKHGLLPHAPHMCGHHPLGSNQCQLVVGTLMQADLFKQRGDHPHQCQVLRFFQDPSTPNIVVMQRLLAARNPNSDPPRIDYDFVPAQRNGTLEEEMVFAL